MSINPLRKPAKERKAFLPIPAVLRLVLFLFISARPGTAYAATPTGVQFTSVSSTSLTVSWTLDSPDEQPLEVLSLDSGFTASISSATGLIGEQTTTHFNLDPHAACYFKVKISTESDGNYTSTIATSTLSNLLQGATVYSVWFTVRNLTFKDYSKIVLARRG